MQIKSTTRYPLTPVKLAIINSADNNCYSEVKGTLLCAPANVNGSSTRQSSVKAPLTVKPRLPCDPASSLQRLSATTQISKRHRHCSAFYNSQYTAAPKCLLTVDEVKRSQCNLTWHEKECTHSNYWITAEPGDNPTK